MSFTGGGTNLGTATYTITGDARGARTAAHQAKSALADLTNVVNNNWWGIRNLGIAFAALPAAIGAGVGAAVKAASTMEDSVFQIQRTSGETGESLNQIVEQVKAVARTTPLATTELMDLAATGAALGVPNEALAEFARIMGVLVTSTNLTNESADDLARVMNIMQVPNSEMERFATTLLEVGRNTAATETEILTIAKRIAPLARTAGITSDQVLSLSAAILSLGPRAEAGGTAFNKTIGDMARAVSKGVSASNKELNIFAEVSNMSAAEFAKAFAERPAEAFATFLTGLARMQGGVQAQIKILDALGITEVRQAQALTALAGGTLSVGNEQRDLNAILAAGTKFHRESNALTDIAAQRAATLSGQIQLLKNIVFEAASGFGEVLLPVLIPFVQLLADLVRGFALLPTPIKAVLIGATLLIGTVVALAAAFVLIAPRVLMARDAFHKLMAAMASYRANSAAVGATMRITGAQATAMANQMARASQLVQISGYRAATGMQALGIAASAYQAKVASTAAASAASAAKFSKFGKGLGIVGTALTVGTIALGVVTARVGKQQRETGDDTGKLSDATIDLAKVNETLSDGLLDSEDNTKKLSKAARELQEALEKVAQAHLSYVDAQMEQRQSAAALVDAERKYREVLEQNADNVRALRRAELELSQARSRYRRSTRDLEKAEYRLANARQIAEEEVAKAEDSLADARDRQIDIADRLVKLEEQLNDLRGEDYLRKITEATNKLRNAELRLARAHQGVADAEWYLNYLREEGASARDIADAEMILAEARQEVADSEEDVSEKTEDLNELRDETRRQREIARLEREIASAHRDAAEAVRDIVRLERELVEVRDDLASGEFLRRAQDEYTDALLDVEEALDRVSLAELKLQSIREGAAGRAIEEAMLDYERALFAVAKANMEARKQQALMRGEIFDAGDEAHVLAEELRKIAANVPDERVRKRLLDLAAVLASAPSVPDPVKESGDAGADVGGGFDPGAAGLDIGEALSDGIKKGIEKKKPEVKKSLWETILGATGGPGGLGATVGGVIGAGLGSVIPGVGTFAGGLLGTAIGFGVGKALEKFPQIGEAIKKIFKFAVNYDSAKAGWNELMNFFSRKGADTAKEVEKLSTKATGNIVREAGNAEKALQKIFLTSEPITKEGADKIIGHVNKMHTETTTAANKMAEDQMASVTWLNENGGAKWKEIADGAVNNITRQKNDTINESESMRAEIEKRISNLRDQGVTITSDMVNQITAEVRRMRNENVQNVTDGSIKQQAVMEKLRAEGTRITKEMAATLIQESAKARDATVSAAENQYTRIVEEAVKLRQAGNISREQADVMINEARRQRDETVATARDQHEKVVGEMRGQRAGINREVDAQSGELKSKWDNMRNLLVPAGKGIIMGLFEGISTEFKNRFKNEWNRLLDSLPGDLADRYKMRSPSRVFAGLGSMMIAGLANGIEDERRHLDQAMQSIMDSLGQEFQASFAAQLQQFDLGYLTRDFASQSAQMGANNTTNNHSVTHNHYNDTLNLEAITNADPDDIMNEYTWAHGVRARRRG